MTKNEKKIKKMKNNMGDYYIFIVGYQLRADEMKKSVYVTHFEGKKKIKINSAEIRKKKL